MINYKSVNTFIFDHESSLSIEPYLTATVHRAKEYEERIE